MIVTITNAETGKEYHRFEADQKWDKVSVRFDMEEINPGELWTDWPLHLRIDINTKLP